MNRRPYIPDLLDSQPQPALALEQKKMKWAIVAPSIDAPFSLFPNDRHVAVDVATAESHGDFHENRSRPIHIGADAQPAR